MGTPKRAKFSIENIIETKSTANATRLSNVGQIKISSNDPFYDQFANTLSSASVSTPEKPFEEAQSSDSTNSDVLLALSSESSSKIETTFEGKVLNKLDELLIRVARLEKHAAETEERSKNKKAISALNTVDHAKLNKLGLPITSLSKMNKLEEQLEKREFAENLVRFLKKKTNHFDEQRLLTIVY